jgi:uncharacterized protein
LAAITITIPFYLQISRVGLDTDLIRLLPENSRTVKVKNQADQIVSGSGGFFALLLESSDREKLIRAHAAAITEVKQLEGIGTLEYKNPSDFYKTYRYALLPLDFLEQVLDFFIRLETRVNPMGEDLLSDEDDKESDTPGSPGSTLNSEDKEKEDKKEIKKMMRYLDLPKFHQSEDGHIMAVKVFPKKGLTSLGKMKRIFTRLDKLAKKISREHSVWTGIGGSMRNSIDQYDFIIADLSRSGAITFITVLLALIIGFRSLRILPVVLLPLVLGLLWTMGSVPILVGDLNTITSFLLLVSFGLGIDFSIHLVKRLQQEMEHRDFESALLETFRSTGKSIAVSGMTTALALFILAFSSFRGFSEFGLVGGYSLVMILLSMIIFLPAICVIGRKLGLLKKMKRNTMSRVSVPGRATTFVILLAIAVSLFLGWRFVSFNYDFSKMDVRAPQEKEIKERFYKVYESVRSPGAMFIAKSNDSLVKLTETLEKKKEKEDSRIQRFHSIREISPNREEFAERLEMIKEIREVISGRWIDRVEDKDYKKWIDDLRGWTAPENPPQLNRLPEDIRNRFSSKSHKEHYIVPIYIKGDKQKGKNAIAFADELNSIENSEIIGPFGDTTVLADVLKVVTAEGPWLVAITLLGIFLLIWWSQRSLRDGIWIILPLISGMLLTMGIMAVAGLHLNFFNVVVFPTLIGMGVDDGVHYYRRWKECGKNTGSTQKELFGPLTLTSVTTIFGYLGIAFSSHPGLQSIGLLACIGLAATWFTTLFLLPGLLKLTTKANML